MSRTFYRCQAAFWRGLAKLVPTCFLQDAMRDRPAVECRRVPLGETATVLAEGPCIVTVNRD